MRRGEGERTWGRSGETEGDKVNVELWIKGSRGNWKGTVVKRENHEVKVIPTQRC